MRKKRRRLAPKLIGLACFSLVVAGCVGFGFASAGSNESDSDVFGLSRTSGQINVNLSSSESEEALESEVSLTSTAQRDMSGADAELYAEEEAEKAAEEQARIDAENAAIAQADQNRQEYLNTFGYLPAGDVDFSIGHDAFVEEWSTRINAYLEGYPLEGLGSVFAEAAWEYGVDPRWSGAISNTESSRGLICFNPHNAWGWGDSMWSTWIDAIYAPGE
ncbi:MAG: CMP-2-keto-3-deoxyoctulosonic acid synthetase, partial [Eggerthellaceae bacterium]|nr:CMP-2-keto-3-deoxyoctulosonic acid synthetase [Eggerthellaceae bacterium]